MSSLGFEPATFGKKVMWCNDARRFDSAFSLLVILHIPDRIAVLKAMYEALKPGGSVSHLSRVLLTRRF